MPLLSRRIRRMIVLWATGLLIGATAMLTPTQTQGTFAQGNGTTPNPIDIDILPIQSAPSDITLSPSSVDENQPSGTVVGALATVDGSGPPFTYTLVSGIGSVDNGQFQITGDQLKTSASFNFEVKNSYTIRIQSEDSTPETVEKQFTISIVDVNEAPADIELSNASVDENKPTGTTVGTLSTTDPDGGDIHTYGLVAGTGDVDNGSFDIVGNQLQTKALFDFETKDSYSVRVETTDGDNVSFAKSFTISIVNVNEAPTNIGLSNASVDENMPTGTVVGTLSTTDPDGGDAHTYSLVAGSGDGDNGSFDIVGSQLRTNAVFDFETAGSYSVRVRSEDAGGLAFERQFTVVITNVNEPPMANEDLAPVSEDSGYTRLSVLDNDDDPEDDPFVVSSVTQPSHGTARIVDNGAAVEYKPSRDYCNNPPGSSLDTFNYTISPGGDTAPVRVRVNCQDDLIVANDNSFVIEPNQPLIINTIAYVDDPDGDLDPRSISVGNGPTNGSTSVQKSSAKITYTPAQGYVGPDAFDYTICDDNRNCDTGRFSLFVSVVDLSLSKNDGGVTVRPGDILSYTLRYTNTGNAAATGVVISEKVPANTKFNAAASRGSWSCSDGATAGVTCKQTVVGVPVNAGGETVFAVRVVAPLPEPATEIVNRAEIAHDNVNGPDLTPANNIAVDRTPIDAGIEFGAKKIDKHLVDADDDGLPSPGDTIRYSIAMTVTGNAPAANVMFVDPLHVATELVANSVTASTGAILSGNQSGDSSVEISLGELPLGQVVAIGYDVFVRNPLPSGISEIDNQAVISGSNFPSALTDDPDTVQPNDPTITFLEAKASLTALKKVKLAIDADNNSVASPGDTLAYTITLDNRGNQALAGIVVTDVVDINTELVAGSVNVNRGTIVSGASGSDTAVVIDIGSLDGDGDAVLLTFQSRIRGSIPGNVEEIVNQAVISSDNLPDILTDDLTFGGAEDPTRITVNANAKVFVSMQDFFIADVDNNSVLSSGDLLIYRLEIFNNGNRNATNIMLENSFDNTMELLAGTVNTSSGIVATGNADGDKSVGVSVASLAGGATIFVSYQVRIGDTFGMNVVRNQAALQYLNNGLLVKTASDDPATSSQLDPTISPVGDATSLQNRLYLPFIAKR